MKSFLTKLNELTKMIVESAFFGIVLMLLSLFGLIWNQIGWLIGIAIGTIVEIIHIVLLYKGSEFISNQNKSSLFLVFFFLRMVVIGIAFLFTALLDFKMHLPAFKNSIFGVLIGISPMELIILFTMNKKDKKSVEVRGDK